MWERYVCQQKIKIALVQLYHSVIWGESCAHCGGTAHWTHWTHWSHWTHNRPPVSAVSGLVTPIDSTAKTTSLSHWEFVVGEIKTISTNIKYDNTFPSNTGMEISNKCWESCDLILVMRAEFGAKLSQLSAAFNVLNRATNISTAIRIRFIYLHLLWQICLGESRLFCLFDKLNLLYVCSGGAETIAEFSQTICFEPLSFFKHFLSTKPCMFKGATLEEEG